MQNYEIVRVIQNSSYKGFYVELSGISVTGVSIEKANPERAI